MNDDYYALALPFSLQLFFDASRIETGSTMIFLGIIIRLFIVPNKKRT